MVKIENEQVGRNCPKCGAPLVYRYSKRTGTQFIGCSAFPKCKYAEFPNSTPPKTLEDKCPLCGKNLVQRNNRRGQPFIGCSGYPKCHYIRKVDKDGNILNPTGKEDLKSLRFKKTKKIEPAIVKAKKTIKKTKINKVK
jgi:DNA topoisomerase-1